MSKTVNATLGAYLTEHNQEFFAEALKRNDHTLLANFLTYCRQDMTHIWTHVGEATITIEMVGIDDIHNNMVKTLRAQRENILAEAQREVMEIDGKIQNLLAIEHTINA